MRLFGPFVDVVSADPRPRGVNVRAASGPPCGTSHTHLDPEKQSSLKALGLLRFHVIVCCLGLRIKEAVGLVPLQKTGPIGLFFGVVGAHVSRQKGV